MDEDLERLLQFIEIGEAELKRVLKCFHDLGEYDTAEFCECCARYEKTCKKHLKKYKYSDRRSGLA